MVIKLLLAEFKGGEVELTYVTLVIKVKSVIT
jgi:hypothetical protein